MQVSVNRKNIRFNPDSSMVITRFLYTGEERALNTIRSVLEMPENFASQVLSPVLRDYSLRHRNISKIFEKHFNKISLACSQCRRTGGICSQCSLFLRIDDS